MHGSKTDRKTDAHPRGAREGRGLPDAFRAASVFHTGHHDAFDEVPLTEEIEHDAGHEGHAGAAHDGGPVRLQGALELAQAHGNRELIIRIDIDHLLEQIVPDLDEEEHGDNDHRRFDGRNDDVEEDTEVACAVDRCSFVELTRDGADELADEEDVERAAAAEIRQDERPERVGHVEELRPHDVQRDERDHGRQQHGADAQREQEVPQAEAQAREGIAAHRGRDGAEDDRRDDDDHRVLQIGPELEVFQRVGVVREQPARR